MWNLLNEWKAEVMEHEAGKYVQKNKKSVRAIKGEIYSYAILKVVSLKLS